MLQFGTPDRIEAIGAWCNGSTPDFESVDPGSNPGAPARANKQIALPSVQDDDPPLNEPLQLLIPVSFQRKPACPSSGPFHLSGECNEG
jgi:hypothetical protein